MALLMRRLLVDAQAKLKRMVEEHPTTGTLASDYPNHTGSSTGGNGVGGGGGGTSSSLCIQSEEDLLEDLAKIRDRSMGDRSSQECYGSGKDTNKSSSSVDSRQSKSVCNSNSFSSSDARKQDDRRVRNRSGILRRFSSQSTEQCKDDLSLSNQTEKSSSPKPGCSNQEEIESLSSKSPRSPELSNGDYLLNRLDADQRSIVLRNLKLENERLHAEVNRLRKLIVTGASSVLAERTTPTNGSAPEEIRDTDAELKLAKEAILTLKADKKKLKAEKNDLLNEVKQLYEAIDEREHELRDFIRNFEQIRESNTSFEQLSTEREERERERWSLLRHARDEAERSLSLAAQLSAKEAQLQQTKEQLKEARRQLASNGCLSDQESLASVPRHSINGGALTPGSGGGLLSGHGLGSLPGDRGSCSADSGVRLNSDRESGGATSVTGNLSDSTTDGTPTIMMEGASNFDADSVSLVSSGPTSHIYQSISSKGHSPTLSAHNANAFSSESNLLSRSVEQLNSPLDAEPVSALGRRLTKHIHVRPGGSRGGTWGSISRVFARSRHRNKNQTLHENSESTDAYRSWSPLTEEGYAEKLRLLREASTVPMERWRAPTVLAWLEVALGMTQYAVRCSENIKSGKIGPLHGQVLLELSDLELECGLGISHPLHRKKLRLAIEEHRQPALIRYPCISQLGHTWVSSEWLPDLGLSQYSESFSTNMVDARMLEHLSKKELEKHLGVTRKFHQASVVHGIHLLRMMKYDRQALAVRRHQCENMDADPLVWTNQRFIKWTRSIDLNEYANNLKESGVHGGLVVLETSFNGDTMATALGIPTSKNIIRRHLTAELDALIMPARYVIFCQIDELQAEAGRVLSKHNS